MEIKEKLAQHSEPEKGSIIAVVATDAPLSDRQLTRLLRRVPIGLARLGSYTGHGSGRRRTIDRRTGADVYLSAECV